MSQGHQTSSLEIWNEYESAGLRELMLLSKELAVKQQQQHNETDTTMTQQNQDYNNLAESLADTSEKPGSTEVAAED